ncbi:MAG: hypothetical protein M1834_002308 [Cirrosporium novae-zelandiae]|nr:MAG: hypothetical protein M1834_002308 [Cirrosporium novae-zelandiae]
MPVPLNTYCPQQPTLPPEILPCPNTTCPDTSCPNTSCPNITCLECPNFPKNLQDPRCEAFPDPGDLLIVVKTGATEAYAKLPVQLVTNLQCAKNFLIFSDLEQDIGKYHLYDALDNVSANVKYEHPDFQLYWKQKEYYANGEDISSLKVNNAGWNLDKFKFLHMMEKTWSMQPHYNWYFFMEADTYIIWSNLLTWLKQFDPIMPLYVGSPTQISDTAFAHGGSGYLLSGATMQRLADDPGIGQRYDSQMLGTCCGDHMLGIALREKGVQLGSAWPMINGEKGRTLPYARDQWCQPLITMHHVNPEEMSQMWKFEQRRKNFEVRTLPNHTTPLNSRVANTLAKNPLLIHELFEFAMEPKLSPLLDDWDNLSDDIRYQSPQIMDDSKSKLWNEMSEIERKAHESFDACRVACKADINCFQWLYHGNTCKFSKSFKLGYKKYIDDGGSYRSGWDVDKIQRFKVEHLPCQQPDWVNTKY